MFVLWRLLLGSYPARQALFGLRALSVELAVVTATALRRAEAHPKIFQGFWRVTRGRRRLFTTGESDQHATLARFSQTLEARPAARHVARSPR